LFSQINSFDDLVIEEDSTNTPYKPSGAYIYFKSKKKAGGMEKISEIENILKSNVEITDIVLVYTEDSPSDLANRETENRNRWENLISAHPELFQYNTNYKSFIQKSNPSNAEAMKNVQGFYVYYSKTTPPPPPAPSKSNDPMTKGDVKKGKEPENQTFEAKETESKKNKNKEKEPVVKEEKKDRKESKKQKEETVKEEKKQEDVFPEPAAEPVKPKKTFTVYTTPRKAKDPKACRPPCYEEGDEGLVNYFKSALALSKKERKKFDEIVTTVKLTLDFNGSIKKTQIMCPDKDLQARVEQALNNMGNWLPAVKGGVTVKSEVRFMLKYDKNSKALLPADFQIIPRPNPKCNKCLSDAEIFGD
jgi:hypothetical protein